MKRKGKKRKSKTVKKRLKIKRRRKAAKPKKKIGISKIFSKKELTKFKELLVRYRGSLVGEVEHITNDTKKSQRDASGDLSGYTLHMADMATDHYDREFSLGIASAEQNIIYEIDEALKRIQDGSYGVCFTCDKKISKKRLKAVPYAKHCVSCQQKEEAVRR